MNEKQIFLIHWLYNFSINEMKKDTDTFFVSDQIKLKEAIERRFPEHASDITKPFEMD